jgi:hypothetical protein
MTRYCDLIAVIIQAKAAGALILIVWNSMTARRLEKIRLNPLKSYRSTRFSAEKVPKKGSGWFGQTQISQDSTEALPEDRRTLLHTYAKFSKRAAAGRLDRYESALTRR